MLKGLFTKVSGIDKFKEAAEQQRLQIQSEFDEQIKSLKEDADQQLLEAREKLKEAEKIAKAADTAIKKTEEKKAKAKMTPKEMATTRGEPWVEVVQTHVKKNNAKNGFFELDWNSVFVDQLRNEGYGFEADPEEEIVDRWFRELCTTIASSEGIDMTHRNAGSVQLTVRKIDEETSEVS
jgi:hypothetical protein